MKPVVVQDRLLADASDDAALEQHIRYCKTADGVRIAYAASGSGTPIVRALSWFTHLEQEWNSPLGRSFWQRLSRHHRLIRYDGRGMGLSDPAMHFSRRTRLEDFESVVNAARLDRFAIVASSEGARTALRYTAQHPERVTHLILYGSNVRNSPGRDDDLNRRERAYFAMIEAGWAQASHRKLFADLFLGAAATATEIEYFAEMQRRSASPEVAIAYARSLAEKEHGFEVAHQIHVPTLIMHPRDDQIIPFENSRDLAAEIPGARLKPLDGDCHWLLLKSARSEEYIQAIEAFLAE